MSVSDPGRGGRIVVVGAAMAGLRTAEQLRSAGWKGSVLLLGEEQHAPYNRPPLSKEVLALPEVSDDVLEPVRLRQRSSAAGVEFRLGERAVASDLIGRTVTLASGESIPYDGLVIATGLRPRRLSVPGPSSGRYVVRTIDDALRLRERLSSGTKVAVIGCGFIGCEVAATAFDLGCEVELVEGGNGPMHHALGSTVSAAMRDWLLRRGVRIHTGQVVEELLAEAESASELGSEPEPPESGRDDGGAVAGVRLGSGVEIDAEVVVEAIGSHPNIEWLQGNGLDLTDGVLTDERLRVVGAEAVVAAGDIARFAGPWTAGVPLRVEHWQNAVDTAKTAARALTAQLTGAEQPQPHAAVPSFWSEIFGVRIQGLGAPHFGTRSVVLEGSLEAVEDGVCVAYDRDGILIGVVTVGLPPAHILRFREHLGRLLTDLTAAVPGP